MFAQQQGSRSLSAVPLGDGCWGATSVRSPGWRGLACLRGVECRGAVAAGVPVRSHRGPGSRDGAGTVVRSEMGKADLK